MAANTKYPQDADQAEKIIQYEQTAWNGMFGDVPPITVPPTSLAKLTNAVGYGTWVEGRTGSKTFYGGDLPMLKTGIKASQIGDTVTITHGNTFDYSDVGNYVVWPDGDHEEIIEWISGLQVKVRTSANKASVGGVRIRGRVYECKYHKTYRKIILHIDNRLFYTNWDMTDGWTEIFCERSLPIGKYPSKYFYFDDNYFLICNSRGTFRVNITTAWPYYWKINTDTPTNVIADIEQNTLQVQFNENFFCRRYLYAMSKLKNWTFNRNRLTVGGNLLIEQESGTTKANANGRDYGELWTRLKRGDGTETRGELVGGWGAGVNISTWAAIDDGTFQFTVNGITVNIECDFTTVTSLEEIAQVVGTAVRFYFPYITCRVEHAVAVARFIFTTGEVDTSTLNFGAAGVGGTDVSGAGFLEITAAFAAIDNADVYTAEQRVSVLVYPNRNENHWTHYSVYGTLDVGPEGTDPVTGLGNNQEQYVYMDDIVCAKAFLITSLAGTVTAVQGTFEPTDVGCYLCLWGGVVAQITTYISAVSVTIDVLAPYVDPTLAGLGLNDERIAAFLTPMWGKIMRCIQTGHTVQVLQGHHFDQNDVGKQLFWSDGSFSHVVSVQGDHTCMVLESSTKTSQAMAMNPFSRSYNDRVTDAVLRDRRDSGYMFLKQRFWQPLPTHDIGCVASGFYCVAWRGRDLVYYSATGEKSLVGYYFPAEQYDKKIDDNIQILLGLPDKVVAICSQTTWYSSTSQLGQSGNASVGEFVALLPVFSKIADKGCVHTNSLVEYKNGMFILVTSEPAVRLFDGTRYGDDNYADKQVQKIIEKASTKVVASYDMVGGYVLWLAEEET